ncbi:hypothetical protein [Parendozoicomonas haliclonae]|nr:hypothetical protein [Parendozoicomonas haliclonae]
MYELPKQWKGDKALKAVRRATQKVLQAVSVESCAEYRHAFRAVSNLFSSPPADAFHLYRSTPSLSQIQTTELKARYLSYHLLMHADHEELLGKALELVAVVTHDWSIINYAGEEVREIWLGHELIRSYRKPKVRTDRGVIRHWSYIDRDCKQVIGNALLKPLQALYNALQPAIAMRLKHELVISQKRTEARTEAVRYRHSQTMKAQRWPTMAKDYICGRIMTREEDGSWRPAIEAEMGNWRRFEYHAPTH